MQRVYLEGEAICFEALRAADATAFEDTDRVAVAHNALDDAYVQAKAKGGTLKRMIETDEVWLCGDLGLLERVLFNLQENAIKFSPGDSQVIMRLWREDSHAVCEIADEGAGIPEDQLGAIFRPFTHAETETNPQQNGVGLGLSFVKVVAEKHHGRVEATSRPGDGARFTLRLPCEVPAS